MTRLAFVCAVLATALFIINCGGGEDGAVFNTYNPPRPSTARASCRCPADVCQALAAIDARAAEMEISLYGTRQTVYTPPACCL